MELDGFVVGVEAADVMAARELLSTHPD